MLKVYYMYCYGTEVHKHCLLSAPYPAHNVHVV